MNMIEEKKLKTNFLKTLTDYYKNYFKQNKIRKCGLKRKIFSAKRFYLIKVHNNHYLF